MLIDNYTKEFEFFDIYYSTHGMCKNVTSFLTECVSCCSSTCNSLIFKKSNRDTPIPVIIINCSCQNCIFYSFVACYV